MPLINSIKNEYSVYGIQDLLACGDFSTFNSMEELAKFYISEIKKKIPDEIYILAGYSAGGTIAFEMARQLKLEKKLISKIIMFDAWGELPHDLLTSNRQKVVIDRQVDSLKLNLFPEFEQKREQWFKTLENRLNLLLNYVPHKLDIDILLFKAATLFGEYEILQKHNYKFSETNGWGKYSTTVETIMIPSHHEEMLKQDNVNLFYMAIKKYLANL
jgi:thioesterase domain-containing protein